MTADLTPRERWERQERPLRYARPRLYADDAKYLQEMLEGTQQDVIEELGELRKGGLTEDSPKIVAAKVELESLANIIREVSRARIDLAGGEGQS